MLVQRMGRPPLSLLPEDMRCAHIIGCSLSYLMKARLSRDFPNYFLRKENFVWKM